MSATLLFAIFLLQVCFIIFVVFSVVFFVALIEVEQKKREERIKQLFREQTRLIEAYARDQEARYRRLKTFLCR